MTRIVLLGEGDFSFAYALSQSVNTVAEWLYLPPTSNEIHIYATSLDSYKEVIQKYPSFVFLKFPSFVHIRHSVNALSLDSFDFAHHADYFIWNHPHLGVEQSQMHFSLLCHFFHTISPLLKSSSTVILSLLTGQIERWRVFEAAKRSSFFLSRSEPFDESRFPGYSCKRNLSGDSFKSSRARLNWRDDLRSHFLFFRKSDEHPPTWSQNFHLFENSIEPLNIVACASCSKTFKSEQGLKTHIRQVPELNMYTGETDMQCLVCNKSFRGKVALEMHTRNAHGDLSVKSAGEFVKKARVDISPRQYECALCGSHETDHVSDFGQNRSIDVLKCKFCEREFNSQRALNQHINVVHS